MSKPTSHHTPGKTGLWLVIFGTIFFLGALLTPIAVITPMIMEDTLNEQFLIPGELELHVDTPGRYTLWNDYKTVFDGKTHNHGYSIPGGLEITLTDADGEKIEFQTSGGNTTVTMGRTTKNNIGSVNITEPKTIQISVQGDVPERVFSFAQSRMREIMGHSLLFIGIALPIGILGLVLAVIGIIKYCSPPKKSAGDPVPGYEKTGL